MGAQELYTRGWLAKSEDEQAQPGENVEYYSNGLADALDYLRDAAMSGGEGAANKETYMADIRSRADLAQQWIDAIENAGISKAGVAQLMSDISDRQHPVRARSSRSANLDALRNYVLEQVRTAGNYFEARTSRPW